MSAELFKNLVDGRDAKAQRFAERVTLAKMSLEDAIKQTSREWLLVQRWVASSVVRPGSFLYLCDEFDLEPDAVRRAIKGGK